MTKRRRVTKAKAACHHKRREPDYSCPLCNRPIFGAAAERCRCYDELTEEQIAADYALRFNDAAAFGQQIEMELA